MPSQLANAVESTPREITFRTHGSVNGPITRLMTPADVGEMIKPFVFLDLFDTNPVPPREIGFHPHSGIATVSLLFQGKFRYEETSGAEGVLGALGAGSVEYMRASGGVWHGGTSYGEERVQGFQLWIALPPDVENAENLSCYLSADDISADGPARVIIGQHGTATSKIPAPPGVNYLDVHLNAGEQWTYQPPEDHDVCWLALQKGQLRVPSDIDTGELVVFDESEDAVHIEGVGEARFVLGSAVKHPHKLFCERSSVHTNEEALRMGQAEIERIGETLRTEGRLQ